MMTLINVCFVVLSDEPTSFTITVTSDVGENGESEYSHGKHVVPLHIIDCSDKLIDFVCVAAVEATIKFSYVERYPDHPPLWEIHSQENLEDRDVEDILTLLQQQVGLCEGDVLSCVLSSSSSSFLTPLT